MKIEMIERHKFIKLIEFALEKKSFSVEQACQASGMSKSEFNSAKYSIFQLRGEHETIRTPQLVLNWDLSPEAFFSYTSFLEFRHAVESARKAQYIAIAAIIISCILAIVSLIR